VLQQQKKTRVIYMSVLFATITNDAIFLCADKMTTNPQTGEVVSDRATKIEKWSSTLAVGGVGDAMLDELVISGVHHQVKEKGLHNFTLEEVADLFGQCYYAVREVYANIMPKDASAQFIIAGKLSNGKLGAARVFCCDDTADMEITEAKNIPSTMVFGPGDITDGECNELFIKAALKTPNKKVHQRDQIEIAHRKAVRYVSERSKFVGPKSDYIVIKP
jgi:hypothetical protein